MTFRVLIRSRLARYLRVTFSWTCLINVTLLDAAATNGCINNGLITFPDSPARNSNPLPAASCMPKMPGPNNHHGATPASRLVLAVRASRELEPFGAFSDFLRFRDVSCFSRGLFLSH